MDSFFQTIQAITFMKDGMTDTMVNKNATMASDLMEIAAEAASPEIRQTVKELKEIHRSGKLKDLFDITDTISFMLNSTTERILERNAEIMRELYGIASEAADPDMLEAVRTIKELQKSGNLKILAEASYMVAFMRNSVTDNIVQRMASFGAAFVEEVSAPSIPDIIRNSTKCINNTVMEFAELPPKPGLKNLIKTMMDPQVQMGLMFMASLAKNMRKCMMETYTAS